MNILHIRNNSDTLGIVASGLCLAHCLATPFLFIAHTGSIMLQDAHPVWWKLLDIVFLVFSFIAIRRSTKTTSKTKMKYAFWISWLLLLVIIINEKLSIVSLPEEMIYVASLSLVVLHFYNLKYCQCEQKCCKINEC
ncbi:MerC domain-containing protein [Aquimarina sp. 2201CG5-10]|uniref:MerC domain-containing protein n=1 Tax=Aquimarina callyspongiae TaxID=3098150 RepID=UPI002AB55B3C|nr:MerC domain-containing protein [Aquimarina sp. 2201CG5-10]MDY8134869.1 MerC domain-containing protein [Aquimarina sp. 2201CG5-10]